MIPQNANERMCMYIFFPFFLLDQLNLILYEYEWLVTIPHRSISVLYAKLTDKGGAERKRCSKLVRAQMRDQIVCSKLFDKSGGEVKMCNEMGSLLLGKVHLDPQLCETAEEVDPSLIC